MQDQITNQSRRSQWTRWAFRALLHCSAVLIMAGLFISFFMTEAIWSVMGHAISDAQVQNKMWTEGLLITGLAACFWAMLYIAFAYFREGRKARKKMAIVKVTGTVLTETLIVFPVFLLLTFGLAQMAVNSMAGLLSTLGVYEAARTIAVWGPEQGHNRTGSGAVTNAHIRDRARIAAAAVIAPVATPLARSANFCDRSDTFNRTIRGMAAAGLMPTVVGTAEVASLSQALGTENYMRRGPAQFASAYCGTNVTFTGGIITQMASSDRTTFTTRLTYDHKIQFPFMGRVFGQMSATGYTTRITRAYSMTQHLSPNPILPKSNDIL